MAEDYEYTTGAQVNVSFGETFSPSKRAPLIAKRIFSTVDDARRFVENRDDTAVAGLILSIVYDPIEDNNGIYQVVTITEPTAPDKNLLALKKVGGASGEKAKYTFADGLIFDGVETVKVKINDKDVILTDGTATKKSSDYVFVNRDGIELKMGNISESTESNRFILDSYDVKKYIDNYDIGTF